MLKAGLGLIALAGVAFTTPAVAQSVYLGGSDSGVSVRVGGDRDRGRHYDGGRHHRSGVVIRERDSYARARCETTRIVRSNGSVKTIRRCS